MSTEPLAVDLTEALVAGRKSMERCLAILLPRFFVPLSIREAINSQTEDIVRTTRLSVLTEVIERFQAIAKDTGDEGFKRAADILLIQVRGELLLMQQHIEKLRPRPSGEEVS